MPEKLLSWLRPARIILLTLALLLAVICLIPQGRLGARFFGLGMRHGASDSRSGMTYATDGVGWRIVRNGADGTSGDMELVRLLFAASPAVSSRYASLFQLGYKCGAAGALFWLALLLIVVLLGAVLYYRKWISQKQINADL